MSRTERWFVAFFKELWRQGTMRTFALWEVALVLFLVGKRMPWWLAIPLFVGWMLVRSLGDEK